MQRPFPLRFPLILVLLALVTPLHGCVEGEEVVDLSSVSSSAQLPPRSEGIPVTTLVADPARYRDQEVTVYGKARAGLAFEFVGEQPFQLEMGKARLWVITSGTAPADGSWVTVRGVVKMPYQLKGRHYPLAVVETARPRP